MMGESWDCWSKSWVSGPGKLQFWSPKAGEEGMFRSRRKAISFFSSCSFQAPSYWAGSCPHLGQISHSPHWVTCYPPPASSRTFSDTPSSNSHLPVLSAFIRSVRLTPKTNHHSMFLGQQSRDSTHLLPHALPLAQCLAHTLGSMKELYNFCPKLKEILSIAPWPEVFKKQCSLQRMGAFKILSGNLKDRKDHP